MKNMWMSCLKRYLGHIIKCHSVLMSLSQVKDGVTPDCYSYSNFHIQASQKTRLYGKCLHWRQGIKGTACRVRG